MAFTPLYEEQTALSKAPRHSEMCYFPSDAIFENDVTCWCGSYLSYDVSVLGVHLSDGPQVTDYAEHLVHLKQRERQPQMSGQQPLRNLVLVTED